MPRMKYCTYKSYFSEFAAEDYDAKTKSINVIFPKGYKRPRLPKQWKQSPFFSRVYFAPNGCTIEIIGSGYCEDYYVRRDKDPFEIATPFFPVPKDVDKTFAASLYARENMIAFVNSIEPREADKKYLATLKF